MKARLLFNKINKLQRQRIKIEKDFDLIKIEFEEEIQPIIEKLSFRRCPKLLNLIFLLLL